jgi:hypothetical protein
MAFVNVQGGNFQNGGSSSATVAITLGAPIGNGNMVCITVGWSTTVSGDTVTVTDNQSNVYTLADKIFGSSVSYMWATFYCLNITNAPQTITATIARSVTFASILADEFSGVGNTLDAHTGQVQVSISAGTNITSGNCTTNFAGDLVYGTTVCAGGASTITKGASFTQGGVNVANTFNTEFLTQGAASASTAATYTHNNVDTFITSVMCFLAAASKAMPPFRRPTRFFTRSF